MEVPPLTLNGHRGTAPGGRQLHPLGPVLSGRGGEGPVAAEGGDHGGPFGYVPVRDSTTHTRPPGVPAAMRTAVCTAATSAAVEMVTATTTRSAGG